jgi:hypothetical protein
MRAGQRVGSPSSTTRATPSGLFCTKPPFEGALRSVVFEIASSRPPQARSEALAAERVTQGLQ